MKTYFIDMKLDTVFIVLYFSTNFNINVYHLLFIGLDVNNPNF